MSHFIQSGNRVEVVSDESIRVFDTLPPRTYRVGYDQRKDEYFLEPIDDFVVPSKIYGDANKRAERILSTFNHRPNATGVHLNGTKGSGKTLLSKLISRNALSQGYATIVVNQPYFGDVFNQFIQSIDCPAVIIFDEFEKVYSWDKQPMLLTLLDGVYPSKKLFILTTNESDRVVGQLKNRPGRIFYAFDYTTLETNFVREYAIDNLRDKSQVESLVRFAQVFSFFNFDMMAAAIEEMNRYNENLNEVLSYLNIRPEMGDMETFTISVTVGSLERVVDSNYQNFNPMSFDYYLGLHRAFGGNSSENDDDVNEAIDSSSDVKPMKNSHSNSKKEEPREKNASYEQENAMFWNLYEPLVRDLMDRDGDVLFRANMLTNFDAHTGTYIYEARGAEETVSMRVSRNKNASMMDIRKVMHLVI